MRNQLVTSHPYYRAGFVLTIAGLAANGPEPRS